MFAKTLSVNIPIVFNGATGVLTEIKSNNIGVYCIIEAEAGVSCEFEMNCRVRFSEL